MEQERNSKIGAKLAGFGRIALQQTKQNVQLAALKAKVGQIKLVDLFKAHYSLGHKAYELRVVPEMFGDLYREIDDLEIAIGIKRNGVTTNASATEIQKLKATASSAKMAAEAEGLKLMLGQKFVALGRSIESSKKK